MLTEDIGKRLDKAYAKFWDCAANIKELEKQQENKKKVKVKDQTYLSIKYIHRLFLACQTQRDKLLLVRKFQQEFTVLEKERLTLIKTSLQCYVQEWPKVFLQTLENSREGVAAISVEERVDSELSSVSLLNALVPEEEREQKGYSSVTLLNVQQTCEIKQQLGGADRSESELQE